MNIEDLKKKLDSEAQQSVHRLEKQIENLKELNLEKDRIIGQFQNRCFTLTKGVICMFCEYKNSCERWGIKND